jgi:hypothetical protein
MCFAPALWNGQDTILKERLFGLGGNEGNHGEDVKECYYYLESTPTHSYMKALYKYPHAAYPYRLLVDENRRRGLDSGVFDHGRYCDIVAEYAKAGPDDILIRLTVANRAAEATVVHLLPTLWCRNTWSWGANYESDWGEPEIRVLDDDRVQVDHASLGSFVLIVDRSDGHPPPLLFTGNETNALRLFGHADGRRYAKDSFHAYVVDGRADAVDPRRAGTKMAAHYLLELGPGEQRVLRLRLCPAGEVPDRPLGDGFDAVFAARIREADEFYAGKIPPALDERERQVARQAYAGLLWTRQFYYYDVSTWLTGDPGQPRPPEQRREGRNRDWPQLFNRDVVSMPDKWEYPWYAAWDLAFHMIPFARIDPAFAKRQLLLFLREWYMHPNGQIPAYEFHFGDVNPPVHAWACWRVYKMTGSRGSRDLDFLARAFHKLLINFTWWVNRKDPQGRNLFAGGFLGLDNIGVFDRSKPLPTGGHLEQADGTAWMAFYCVTMLSMALELAGHDPSYEDVASKFFEHFVAIVDAMNALGGRGLWDEHDGFYYDQILVDGDAIPLQIRSLVGLVPLVAVELLDNDVIERLPGFRKRMDWFLEHRRDLTAEVACMELDRSGPHAYRLLAVPNREHLRRVLGYLLDEGEFLSPHGLRSLSQHHAEHPFVFHHDGTAHTVAYVPGESDNELFGGNSNWRGPVWFPINYLIIEALERYHRFFGDDFVIECPTGSGRMMTLQQVAEELDRRHAALFVPDADGRRPAHGRDRIYAEDPHWRDLVLFYEYFHGDDGRGLGASHQTGWTALVLRCLETWAAAREQDAGAGDWKRGSSRDPDVRAADG